MSIESLVTNKVCADCEHKEVCHHKGIIQAIYEHFMSESESEDRPDFLKKRFNVPMAKENE